MQALPEELAELFRGLELKLLREICSRLKISGQLNEVTVQDIRALRAYGIDLDDIKKAIAEAANTGMEKLEALLDDVVQRNQAYYTSMIDLAQVTAPERLVDERDIAAIRRQTWGAYKNITGSMGFLVVKGGRLTLLPPAQTYQWVMDNAEVQIMSGATSYSQAFADAVRQLAASGLCVAYDKNGNLIKNRVAYESGHHDHLDVAVRRAVMTGVNQINQKYREQSMDYLETDLVEVTAHSGARDKDGKNKWDNHKKWQGFVYRWRAKPRTSKGDYPDFEDTCGYGSVTGIGGANCRHSFWPYIEGVSERTYTDKELADIDPPPIEFEGKKYTAYEATQMQRRIEREIRKQKRLQTGYDSAGLTEDAAAAGAKLRTLNKKYKAFSKAAGLPEQRERLRVLYPDDASIQAAKSMKLKRDAEAPIREAIRSRKYSRVINPEKQARHMAATAKPGRSVITVSQEELQNIVNKQAGSGSIRFKRGTFIWKNQEIIDAGKEVGYTINEKGDTIKTASLKIHYSKTGVHAVPFSGRWKK